MNFTDGQQQPILILDTERCKRNISRIADRARKAGCIFRPHFKTHQSRVVGRWFREADVSGITVSSISMAEYFIEDGWNDVTIAFPFFRNQLPGLQKIEHNTRLRLFVNTPEDLDLLDRELQNSFRFMIEIDPEYGRSGILYKETELIKQLIETANKLEKPQFHGFYIHDGRTYHARNKQQINKKINPVIDILVDLKKQFPEAAISLGDTPSASVSDRLHELDELTPGNFAFYDYMQVNIGSCTLDDVALYAVLPVGQRFPESGRSILHGGAAHLSKDFIIQKEQKNYGQLIEYSPGSGISEVNNTFLTSLSQEHGTLNGLPPFDTGQVWICPIHSCLTANLHQQYFSSDGEIIPKRILS